MGCSGVGVRGGGGGGGGGGAGVEGFNPTMAILLLFLHNSIHCQVC